MISAEPAGLHGLKRSRLLVLPATSDATLVRPTSDQPGTARLKLDPQPAGTSLLPRLGVRALGQPLLSLPRPSPAVQEAGVGEPAE